MGDAMGKSRHAPWSADFSGQWCATVKECIEEKKCHSRSLSSFASGKGQTILWNVEVELRDIRPLWESIR